MDKTIVRESEIFKTLQSLARAEIVDDPFEKVQTLRNGISQLYSDSLASNDERFTCSLVQRHLHNYQNVLIDPDSVNNYCDEVMQLLAADQDEADDEDPGISETALGDAVSYLTAERLCKGQFEDCASWELDDVAIQSLFESNAKHEGYEIVNVNDDHMFRESEKRVAEPDGGFKTNTMSTKTPKENITSLPGIKRMDTVNLEDISKRVFAPPTRSFFTPKVPTCSSNSSRSPADSAFNSRNNDNANEQPKTDENNFRTAKDELQIQNIKKYGNANPPGKTPLFAYGKKSLGGRRTLGGKFVCPVRNEGQDGTNRTGTITSPSSSRYSQEDKPEDEEIDERLRHIDPKMVELIRSEIMDRFTPLTWEDIAGLEYAKTIIQEAVVWPILRPDIFTGLRRPPRGILLFGPPGTGKTLIGKCIASQSKSTFFSISASSLTSKWIGDGEKMVRALFAVASVHQPAVVFIDEIDSLLCQRSETEHESSRRLKTEFLVQLDGAATAEDERILIVGATNRPQELDEAARRRLVKRLYIPLPELPARVQILSRLLGSEKNSLSSAEINDIGQMTEGFSGADMKVLCHEASMGPIRSIPFEQLGQIGKDDVRPVCYEDFKAALSRVRASVSPNDLTQYVKWDRLYGSGASS